jgi:peptidoglycan/LPS O-acetylase OafA/YrhL
MSHGEGTVAQLAGPSHASFIHLDMLRGIAALLVMLGHLRSFVFYPYGELANPNLLDKAVWALTGLGHQAVMVFFVLSGFFITRSIVLDCRRGRFSWTDYLIKRATRLWIVLIPCLLMTFLWDSIGISFSKGSFYEGKLFAMYNSGPNLILGGADLSLSTFVKNVLFLQTIIGPTFGSNGPLWSLANEFWYYLMFPLFYVAITRPRNWTVAAINFGLFVAASVFVGASIVLSGLVWLAGAAAYLIYDRGWLAPMLRSSISFSIAVVVFLLSLAASKMNFGGDLVKDYLVGLGATALVLVLTERESHSALFRQLAHGIADASYTVYLAHFPFLAMAASVLLQNHQFSNSALGYVVFGGLGLTTLFYCYGVYWLFERHTTVVRRFCLAKAKLATSYAFGA